MELRGVENLLEGCFGSSKGGFTDTSQIQFCCPACADDDGVESDNKYNLEINVFNGVYRCWKCEYYNDMRGSIFKLLRRYGGESKVNEYKGIINDIKASKEYEFNFSYDDSSFGEEEIETTLPKTTYEFKFDGNGYEKKALDFLINERGLNEQIIKKYDIRYTNGNCTYEYRSFKNRIIFPSYDKFKNLNYYLGRNYGDEYFYIGDKKIKVFGYMNYKKSKKEEIIFNEHLINWDGDITLVEGPFDHVVIPNSIPLLGKELNSNFMVFDYLIKKSKANIMIFLDDDAELAIKRISTRLSCLETCDRIKIIPTAKIRNEINKRDGLNIESLDPSLLFKLKGKQGISHALKSAENFVCR